MIEFEDGEEEEGGGGSPAWMATFADLMSLLMCFFVLLLSFSEMDVAKYKQIAGSIKYAFGVQTEVRAQEIPKGTSIIAKEFSSARPQPTPINEVRQSTADTEKQSLDVRAPDPGTNESKPELTEEQKEEVLREKLQQMLNDTKADADKLSQTLAKEIEAGMIDVESSGRSITIRIRERGSFQSGSADLNAEFSPVLDSIRFALVDIQGEIAIEGHTDDVPIGRSSAFSSNWELSSSRALVVTHELTKDDSLNEDRFMMIGYADTRPIAENDSSENRAKNRRVEITIRQGLNNSVEKPLNELNAPEVNASESVDEAPLEAQELQE